MARPRTAKIGDFLVLSYGKSHGAHVMHHGKEIDYFNYGDQSKNKTSYSEWQRAIRTKRKYGF